MELVRIPRAVVATGDAAFAANFRSDRIAPAIAFTQTDFS
jgi:hypothetical protein